MSTRTRRKLGALNSLLERSTNMPDPTLTIVFRNPHPQRSPIDNELNLLRRDGSSSRFHYSDQSESPGGEEAVRPTIFRRLTELIS